MSAVLSIRPIKALPAELQCGARNGALGADVLADVGHGGRLSLTTARAWNALYVAMAADGFTGDRALTFTPGGTYRTLAAQEWVFGQRYEITDQTARVRDGDRFYLGSWWRIKRNALGRDRFEGVAAPGNSNHGLGLAVDTALGASPATATSITPALPWLVEHAHEFGFSWELQREPWHLRYVEGPDLPPRVLAIEAWLAAQVQP